MSSLDGNIYSVGGTSIGALSQEEIRQTIELYAQNYTSTSIVSAQSLSQSAIVGLNEASNLSAAMNRMSSAVNYHFSALSDPARSTKYQSDFSVANIAGGCLSVDPLFGRMIFANSDSQETKGVLRADGKNSHMYSAGTSTTLGSPNIDTASGYDMNFLSSDLPSSIITPVKTWMLKLFPILTDKRLIGIAVVEGLLILIGKFLEQNNKETLSEQIESRDLGTIIIDNQEIENSLLQP